MYIKHFTLIKIDVYINIRTRKSFHSNRGPGRFLHNMSWQVDNMWQQNYAVPEV